MTNIISIEPALKYINYETDDDDEGFLEKHPNLKSILPKLDELREREIANLLKKAEERRNKR